ncbi:MAG: hypothetical protein HY318_04250, partial [Armatimonadetes bacterium]|nr:hypothetical protein [Armatimonadota bacterium]
GHLAAMTMLRHGVGREAFRIFWRDCHEFVRDIWHGRLVRRATNLVSHRFSLGPVVALAKVEPGFRTALYDCVSGRETYRRILQRPGNLRIALRLGGALLREKLSRRSHGSEAGTPTPRP